MDNPFSSLISGLLKQTEPRLTVDLPLVGPLLINLRAPGNCGYPGGSNRFWCWAYIRRALHVGNEFFETYFLLFDLSSMEHITTSRFSKMNFARRPARFVTLRSGLDRRTYCSNDDNDNNTDIVHANCIHTYAAPLICWLFTTKHSNRSVRCQFVINSNAIRCWKIKNKQNIIVTQPSAKPWVR
jgi:hypothetical protein